MSAMGTAKLTVALIVVLGLPMLPMAGLGFFGLSAGAGIWALAAIAASMAAMLSVPRVGLLIAVGLGVLSTIGYAVAHQAWGAGLVMAVAAGLYGLTAKYGITGAVLTAPIALNFTIADPTVILTHSDSTTNALVTGAIALVAGLWGTLVGWLLGKRVASSPTHPVSVPLTRAFAVMIAVVTGLAMALVSHLNWGHTGAWFVLTLLVVIQPNLHDTGVKALHRALGTLLGFVIAYAIAAVVSPPWALYVLSFALLVAAMQIKLDPSKPYWLYATFLTPMIVLLEGASGDILTTDVNRLVATLCGVAVALLVVIALHPLYRRADARFKERDAQEGATA